MVAARSIVDLPLSVWAVRAALHLSRERFARLLDVSTRTVERWENGGELPSMVSVRQRLARLRELSELGLLVYDRSEFRRFLGLPLPAFEGRTALQIAESGDVERVVGTLASLYEGQGI